ncbi:MAG: hypothetical protein OXD01_13665 [Gammaproteobacteria bacterium]|nr:hypothetical protein [Gammaproteobacteria bacterium]
MKAIFRCLYLAGIYFLGSAGGIFPTLGYAQDDLSVDLNEIEIAQHQLPRCFGFTDISELQALGVCDALNLGKNVKARELSEQWVRQEPHSPAAQYALAEVLLTVEGNMPRALFHLNQAEDLTPFNTLEEAVESGMVQWHYLTISQLSHVHQLMGDQIKSLEYLDRLEAIYGQEVESFRGWPLIKMKQYEAAKTSARHVLETTQDESARSRAWNTLCAAELASLAPIESTSACDRAISEDEDLANPANDYDTVYLTNASEVALSLLQFDVAESFLDRATRYLNPDSVADPWIYKLYLALNQGRFDEAKNSLDRMMVWCQQQQPLVSVMNRAEHFLVSASFLMVAGYAEDAVKLTLTAMNQPDRNGSYSADDEQKDAFAALLNMAATRTELEIQNELRATMGTLTSWQHRWHIAALGLQAWRSERKAASLFANFEVLQSRLRPYAPLDVHIPEWIEPELIKMMGTGVVSEVLEQARSNGAFQLNEGYYHAYHTEVAAVDGNDLQVVASGQAALSNLPAAEVMLRARVAAQLGKALWSVGETTQAMTMYQLALTQDPSIVRRLGLSLPVVVTTDNTVLAMNTASYLEKSPRFSSQSNGFLLEVRTNPGPSICLRTINGAALSCYTLGTAGNDNSEETLEINETADGLSLAQSLVNGFHTNTFGLGYDISKAQRSALLGSSVYLNAQSNANPLRSKEAFLAQ